MPTLISLWTRSERSTSRRSARWREFFFSSDFLFYVRPVSGISFCIVFISVCTELTCAISPLSACFYEGWSEVVLLIDTSDAIQPIALFTLVRMRSPATLGPLALAMVYTWDELELADCSLYEGDLAHAVAVLAIRPSLVPRHSTIVDPDSTEGKAVGRLAARCPQMRVLAIDDRYSQHQRIASAMHELTTRLGPQQLPQLRTMTIRWWVGSPYVSHMQTAPIDDAIYDDIIDRIRMIAPGLESVGVTSCGIRDGGKLLFPVNSQTGRESLIRPGVMSLGAVGEVRKGFAALLSSKQLRGLDLRLCAQDFYHPGRVLWRSLRDIAPRLKWLRLCIPDPSFNIPAGLNQHPMVAEPTASYPMAALKFVSHCTALRTLVICNNSAERIKLVLSNLSHKSQLQEFRIEIPAISRLAVAQVLFRELPLWIEKYPYCRKLRVLDLGFLEVIPPSLKSFLRARRIVLRRNFEPYIA